MLLQEAKWRVALGLLVGALFAAVAAWYLGALLFAGVAPSGVDLVTSLMVAAAGLFGMRLVVGVSRSVEIADPVVIEKPGRRLEFPVRSVMFRVQRHRDRSVVRFRTRTTYSFQVYRDPRWVIGEVPILAAQIPLVTEAVTKVGGSIEAPDA